MAGEILESILGTLLSIIIINTLYNLDLVTDDYWVILQKQFLLILMEKWLIKQNDIWSAVQNSAAS